jgi:hypothetical protein
MIFRSEKGGLDRARPILRSVQVSVHPTAEWFAISRQAVQTLQAASQQQQRMLISQALRSAGLQGAVFDQLHRQYQEREASRDRIQEQFIQTVRGVEKYRDPMQEMPIELPMGYRDAWTNPNGDYLISDDPNFDPNVGAAVTWRKLDKLPRGQRY